MPAIPAVLRTLPSGHIVAEPLTMSEVSAVAASSQAALQGLSQRAAELLQKDNADNAAVLHRRWAEVREPEVLSLELELKPPRREVAWQEPVMLSLQAVHWTEGEERPLHHLVVPGTEVHAMAADADSARLRAMDHLRLLLLRKGVGLRSLWGVAQSESMTLTQIHVSAALKTPRQLAEEKEGKKEEPSVLAEIAEALFVPTAIEPAFELDASVRQLAEALSGSEPKSVLIVGPPGAGKSAMMREFARQRRELGFPNTPMWTTSAARLIAGQTGFGMWQERCRDMIREVGKAKGILHLGNLWELMEVGKFIGNTQSIASFLRPAIARGDMLCVAECTGEQLAIIERQEAHLAAVFHIIRHDEAKPEVAHRILAKAYDRWRVGSLTNKAKAQSAAALDWLHRLHLRYATYSAAPGRPLLFLLRLMLDRANNHPLSEAEVTEAFTRETGLPALLLDDALPLDVAATRSWFAMRVLGQTEAVEAMVSVLAMIKTRLNRPRQPLASLLFIGPTGTGKTELAKALAQYLFGNVSRLARFDLNEFSDSFSVQRLIGGPAAGSNEGLLTARVREHPFSVLLFDEFEKADPAFFDLLLQILGDGRLTDASGRVADFCNTVIIMTSNLGARDFQRGSIGFGPLAKSEASGAAETAGKTQEAKHFASAVRDFLRPEIYNRLGAIVPFHALSRELAASVLQRHLGLLRERDGLQRYDAQLLLEDGVEAWLLERGFDARYGARPLKRVLERSLMTPVAEALNAMFVPSRSGCLITVSVAPAKDRLLVSARSRSIRAEQQLEATERFKLSRAVQSLRRDADRLRRCSNIREVENEVPLLQQAERRAKRSEHKLTPSEALQLHRLAVVRAFLASADAIVQRCCDLETTVILAVQQQTALDHEELKREHTDCENQLRDLRREVLRTTDPTHADVMLMLIADDNAWLHTIARVYQKFATGLSARLTGLEYVSPPAPSSKLGNAVRAPCETLDSFLDQPPQGHVGLLMRFTGDLIGIALRHEEGLHVLKHGTSVRCEVTVHASSEWTKFIVPGQAHRASYLEASAVTQRRAFHADKGHVADGFCGLNMFTEKGLSTAMENLLAEHFQQLIADVVQ